MYIGKLHTAMTKEIEVHNVVLHEGDIVNTIEGRARLEYIGRQFFTNWTLLEKTEMFPFGRPVTIEDNCLDKFVINLTPRVNI